MTAPPAHPQAPEASTPVPVPFPILRSAGILAAVVSTLTWGVYYVLTSMGYPIQANLNAVAAAVCGGAGLVGLWPVWSMSRRSIHGAATGFMAGILLRMLVCGAVVLAAQYTGHAHAQALTYWVAGWYMVVLAVEVKLVSSFALTHSQGTGTRDSGSGSATTPTP